MVIESGTAARADDAVDEHVGALTASRATQIPSSARGGVLSNPETTNLLKATGICLYHRSNQVVHFMASQFSWSKLRIVDLNASSCVTMAGKM